MSYYVNNYMKTQKGFFVFFDDQDERDREEAWALISAEERDPTKIAIWRRVMVMYPIPSSVGTVGFPRPGYVTNNAERIDLAERIRQKMMS